MKRSLKKYNDGGKTKRPVFPGKLDNRVVSDNTSVQRPTIQKQDVRLKTPQEVKKANRENFQKRIGVKPTYNVQELTDFGTPEPGLEDASLEALDALSLASGVGYLAKKGLGTGVNYLGNKYLPNAYKYNPLAFKPNPEAYYRGIGRSGLDDALENKVIRPHKKGTYDKLYFTDDIKHTNIYAADPPKYKGDPFSQIGDDAWELIPGDYKKYIAEIPKKNIPFAESVTKGTRNGLPAKGPYYTSEEFPSIDNVKFYKEDWLRGYKPIQYPNGGKVKPIVVNDPNDPRLKAYNDSLSLYNKGKSYLNEPYSDNLYNYTQQLILFGNRKKIAPTTNERGISELMIPQYKKPVQPVIYKEGINKVKINSEQIKPLYQAPQLTIPERLELSMNRPDVVQSAEGPTFKQGRKFMRETGLRPGFYEEGGKVNPLEADIISNVIMNRNRDKNFVNRAYALGQNPGMFTLQDPENFGDVMSHKMAWGTDDAGQAYMFPTVMNANNEAIKIPNQYADYISSEGYKKATGMEYAYGGTINNMKKRTLKRYTGGGSTGAAAGTLSTVANAVAPGAGLAIPILDQINTMTSDEYGAPKSGIAGVINRSNPLANLSRVMEGKDVGRSLLGLSGVGTIAEATGLSKKLFGKSDYEVEAEKREFDKNNLELSRRMNTNTNWGNSNINTSTNMMFAKGGMVLDYDDPNANAELELQETFQMPDGTVGNVDGPSHENGGVAVDLPEGTRIWSDKLKHNGKTFAKHTKPITSKIAKLEKQIAKNPVNSEAKENSIALLNDQLDYYFDTQETNKQEKEMKRTFRKGGLVKYDGGGTASPFTYKGRMTPQEIPDSREAARKILELRKSKYGVPYDETDIQQLMQPTLGGNWPTNVGMELDATPEAFSSQMSSPQNLDYYYNDMLQKIKQEGEYEPNWPSLKGTFGSNEKITKPMTKEDFVNMYYGKEKQYNIDRYNNYYEDQYFKPYEQYKNQNPGLYQNIQQPPQQIQPQIEAVETPINKVTMQANQIPMLNRSLPVKFQSTIPNINTNLNFNKPIQRMSPEQSMVTSRSLNQIGNTPTILPVQRATGRYGEFVRPQVTTPGTGVYNTNYKEFNPFNKNEGNRFSTPYAMDYETDANIPKGQPIGSTAGAGMDNLGFTSETSNSNWFTNNKGLIGQLGTAALSAGIQSGRVNRLARPRTLADVRLSDKIANPNLVDYSAERNAIDRAALNAMSDAQRGFGSSAAAQAFKNKARLNQLEGTGRSFQGQENTNAQIRNQFLNARSEAAMREAMMNNEIDKYNLENVYDYDTTKLAAKNNITAILGNTASQAFGKQTDFKNQMEQAKILANARERSVNANTVIGSNYEKAYFDSLTSEQKILHNRQREDLGLPAMKYGGTIKKRSFKK